MGRHAMTPGAYLRKRREAAGLSPRQVAERLSGLPWALRLACERDIALLESRVARVELGYEIFTLAQAELLRNVFAFDTGVYELLLLLRDAPLGHGLPVPQICTRCACTWFVPCMTDHGPCAWSDHNAELCTACERATAAEAELAPAVAEPQPRAEGAAL